MSTLSTPARLLRLASVGVREPSTHLVTEAGLTPTRAATSF